MSETPEIDPDLYRAKWLDSQSVVALQRQRNRNKKTGKIMSKQKKQTEVQPITSGRLDSIGTDPRTEAANLLKAIYRSGATGTPRNLTQDLETITKLTKGN